MVVDEADVRRVVSEVTGIPSEKLSAGSAGRLAVLDDALRALLVGQEEAVAAVAATIKSLRLGLFQVG